MIDPRARAARDHSPATRLRVLFLTVFVDLIGFGIVLPLLPFYADRFGASATVIGLLVMVYSLAQLFMGPVWGRLSDRFGRRPILLVGLVSSAASYLVFAYASSLPLLFLSRAMAGFGGATVPVAQAYIADITTPERRAGSMGLVGAAFGLGFIFGPALGGMLAPVSVHAPGIFAATLCLTNAVLAFFLLPESLTRAERSERAGVGLPLPVASLRGTLWSAAVMRLLALSFLFTIAFAAMQPTFPLFGAARFGLRESSVGYLFAFLGLVSAIVQGGLVRRLVPILGEVRLIRICSAPFTAGLVLIAVAPTLTVLLLALALLAVGFGGTLPSVASLLSRVAPTELQGGILGIGQSVGSLARVVGPLMAGLSFDRLGMAWPYLLGACVAAAASVAAFTLRQPPTESGAPAIPAPL